MTRITRIALLVFAWVLLCIAPKAQELPDAPQHKFIDKQNSIALLSMAAAFAGDGATTAIRNDRGWRKESNPIVKDIQGDTTANVAYFAGTFALTATSAYVFHKSNHHRLERVTLWAGTAIEAFWTVRNAYQLKKY